MTCDYCYCLFPTQYVKSGTCSLSLAVISFFFFYVIRVTDNGYSDSVKTATISIVDMSLVRRLQVFQGRISLFPCDSATNWPDMFTAVFFVFLFLFSRLSFVDQQFLMRRCVSVSKLL